MKVTFYGHASFSIEFGGKHLLFDPFFTGNPKNQHINPEEINPDYILVTHGHGDHVADVESIARRSGATIISNYEIATWYGAKELKAHPMNHGGKFNFDFGTVKYVNAVHTSCLPDGSNGGDPGGFVIWNDDECFYFAGDTALTKDMELIPLTCPPLKFAIFPIGDNFTMGYEDAAIASQFVKCNKIVGCHYDTFGYIEIDKSAARLSFEAKGSQLLLPDIGETIEI